MLDRPGRPVKDRIATVWTREQQGILVRSLFCGTLIVHPMAVQAVLRTRQFRQRIMAADGYRSAQGGRVSLPLTGHHSWKNSGQSGCTIVSPGCMISSQCS
jgi:hypothetical protein